MADTPAPQLKHMFDEERYRTLARLTHAIEPKFERRRFLELTLEGLEERSLMQRMQQTAIALGSTLPGEYRAQLDVLRKLAPEINHGFVAIFLSDFVARFGLHDFDLSMDALRYFTRFGSAEFSVRHFLVRDFERAHATMLAWTGDESEHVRRLSSEGIRPRLPWGMRLQSLVKDPSPLAPILEALKHDSSLYVRKSVANNLNDITKDHPQWVLKRLSGWDRSRADVAWIAKQACRTLIKKGDPNALALFGFGRKASVKASLFCDPQRLRLGQKLNITARVDSTASTSQTLAIDYVIHYVKTDGSTAAKVFKWSEQKLAKGARLELAKSQTIKDFTTRKHNAGMHRVELQINGQRVAESAFEILK